MESWLSIPISARRAFALIPQQLYIHRILHDLDVEYNNYKPNNKFGFSNYDSGGENQMLLSNYIKENGLSEDTYYVSSDI